MTARLWADKRANLALMKAVVSFFIVSLWIPKQTTEPLSTGA